MSYGLDRHSNGCCGVYEWMDFNNWADDDTGYHVVADDFKTLLQKMQESGIGFMNHIHFVKRRGEDQYEWNELRDLISELPTAKHMGVFKNPNTGNMIDSWCWTEPKE